MSGYSLTPGEYRGAKSRLTRAQKTGNPQKVIAATRFCLALFERKGYPDDWHRWKRALEDAQMDLQHAAPGAHTNGPWMAR